MESIGARIRRIRDEQGVSRAELAKAVGLAYSSLSDLESGKAKTTTVLHKIAARLGVNVDWLETGKGSPAIAGPATPTRSQSVRLDTSIISSVARALHQVYAEQGLTYDLEAEPERFAWLYELGVAALASGEVSPPENLVRLMIKQDAARGRPNNEGSDTRPTGGTTEGGNERHRAKA